jgi:hypothetical protein
VDADRAVAAAAERPPLVAVAATGNRRLDLRARRGVEIAVGTIERPSIRAPSRMNWPKRA